MLGFDVAGVVVAKGRECSDRLSVGDKVWADLGKIKFFGFLPQPQLGAYAEYAVADESQTGLMPKHLNFVQAASLPLVSLTSFQAFNKVRSSFRRSNLTVAITSGAGKHLVLVEFIKLLPNATVCRWNGVCGYSAS